MSLHNVSSFATAARTRWQRTAFVRILSKRLMLSSLLALFLVWSASLPALAQSLTYIVNFRDNTISIIYTATHEIKNPPVRAVIDVRMNPADIANGVQYGPIGAAVTPYNIHGNANATFVYVTNNLNNSVSVVDVAKAKVVQVIRDVPSPDRPFDRPKGVAISPICVNETVNPVGEPCYPHNQLKGTFAYVTNEGDPANYDGFVSVIDTDPQSPTFNTVVKTIPVGRGPSAVALTKPTLEQAPPNGMRFASGFFAYVTNTASNTVSVIDTDPTHTSTFHTVVKTINLNAPGRADAQQPVAVAFDRFSTRAYVVNAGTNNVTAIKTCNDRACGLQPTPNHTVTFNVNGGTGTMAPQTANIPTALTPNAFTRAGYLFNEWTTAVDGTGTKYADKAIYDFSADITLYAQWTALQIHSIPLVGGWNLVSFNVHPTDTAIGAVLSGINGKYDLVYAWDATGAHSSIGNWMMYAPPPAPPYQNTLSTLDETMGLWIHMTTPATLDVTGMVPTTTTIPLRVNAGGWNLVSYPSNVARALPGALQDNGVGTDFTLVYAYHANDVADPWKLFDRTALPYANDLTELTPGWGYWIEVNANHNWSLKFQSGTVTTPSLINTYALQALTDVHVVEKHIAVGQNPAGIAVTVDFTGSRTCEDLRAYVANKGSNSISVINIQEVDSHTGASCANFQKVVTTTPMCSAAGNHPYIPPASFQCIGADQPTGVSMMYPDEDFVYVTNSGTHSVSVFDSDPDSNPLQYNFEVGRVVDFVGDTPKGIANTPRIPYAYVMNSGSRTISVVGASPQIGDPHPILATISANSGLNFSPGWVTLNRNQDFIFVTDPVARRIHVINTMSQTVVGRTEPLPGTARPVRVATPPDGLSMYVTMDDGTVFAIDTVDRGQEYIPNFLQNNPFNEKVVTFPLVAPGDPESKRKVVKPRSCPLGDPETGAAADPSFPSYEDKCRGVKGPDGKYTGGHKVELRDPNTNKQCVGPGGLDFHPDDFRGLVACKGSDDVFVFDSHYDSNTWNQTLRRIPLAAGSGPLSVAFTHNGQRALVLRSDGKVSIINSSSLSEVAVVSVGTNPLAVAFAEQDRYAYVTNSGSGTVSVIDLGATPPAVVATIDLLGYQVSQTQVPRCLNPQDAFINLGERTAVYVTCKDNDTVYIINSQKGDGASWNTVVDRVYLGQGSSPVGLILTEP